MSDAVVLGFMIFLGQIVIALPQILLALQARKKVEDIRHQTNSLVAQITDQAEEKGRKRGAADERDRNRDDRLAGGGSMPLP